MGQPAHITLTAMTICAAVLALASAEPLASASRMSQLGTVVSPEARPIVPASPVANLASLQPDIKVPERHQFRQDDLSAPPGDARELARGVEPSGSQHADGIVADAIPELTETPVRVSPRLKPKQPDLGSSQPFRAERIASAEASPTTPRMTSAAPMKGLRDGGAIRHDSGARPARSLNRNGLMGGPEIRFADIDAIADFAIVRAGLASDIETLRACRSRGCGSELGRLAERLSGLHESDLGAVNALANAVPYRSDALNWAASDHWARPMDMLKRGGDCEDFALLKFAALSALGVPDDRMRIVIGHTRAGTPHVVLSVDTGRGTVFLDNRTDRVLLAAETDLIPRYSVNRQARWTHIRPRMNRRYASRAGATL